MTTMYLYYRDIKDDDELRYVNGDIFQLREYFEERQHDVDFIMITLSDDGEREYVWAVGTEISDRLHQHTTGISEDFVPHPGFFKSSQVDSGYNQSYQEPAMGNSMGGMPMEEGGMYNDPYTQQQGMAYQPPLEHMGSPPPIVPATQPQTPVFGNNSPAVPIGQPVESPPYQDGM